MQVLTKAEIRHDLVTYKHKFEAAQHELEQFQWVDVNERLPETKPICSADEDGYYEYSEEVLCKRFNGMSHMVLYYQVTNDSAFWMSNEWRSDMDGVTHWMQLPKGVK